MDRRLDMVGSDLGINEINTRKQRASNVQANRGRGFQGSNYVTLG